MKTHQMYKHPPVLNINSIADAVHASAIEKGFHEVKDDRLFMQEQWNNTHCEISELQEAYRKGTLFNRCDKGDEMEAMGLTPLTCIEEEYADIIIRCLDQCRRLGVDISMAINVKHEFNKTRPFKHGKVH